jgi:hypothetical protein
MKLEKKALIFLSNKRKNLGLVKINKLDQLLFINKKKRGVCCYPFERNKSF